MAVCSVMNYREAAELLHITQPAVTQHIQFLEKEYGCRLFLYENRKLIKTPAAQMLEDYLRSVQQRENFLREKIKNNGLRELRIGATKTIGDYVITDRIHDFLNQLSIPIKTSTFFGNSEHSFPEKQSIPFRNRVQFIF